MGHIYVGSTAMRPKILAFFIKFGKEIIYCREQLIKYIQLYSPLLVEKRKKTLKVRVRELGSSD